MIDAATYQTLVHLHAAFGSVALAAFWWQVMARKRGPRHRRVGQVYFLALTCVVITAVPMTAYLARGAHWGSALFLAFLAWITLAAGIGSWLASRWRNRRLTRQRRFGAAASWGLLALSLIMLALFQVGGALFAGLGAFGTWAAIADLRRPADDLVWTDWQVRHIEGVMGTGMAVHIAFLAFGLRGLLGQDYNNLHFLLAFAVPVVVFTGISSFFIRRRRPPAAAGRTRTESAGSAEPGSAPGG